MGGLKAGGTNAENVEVKKGGAQKGGSQKIVGLEGWAAQNFARFLVLRPDFRSLSPSLVESSRRATSGHATQWYRLLQSGGELVVLGTRLLSGSAHGCCLLTSRKVKSRRRCWKLKMNEEKESELDGEVEERVIQRAHETWR